MQKLRLDWNYNSNAIEGNKLSYGETVAFLMEGITAKGKPLKDHLDIRGHNQAINFLLKVVKDSRPISESDIRALHKMILVEPYDVKAQTTDGQPTTKRITLGEYKTSANHVQTATGETHYYATPEETPAKMQELMEWYNEVTGNKETHPVVAAALFHHKFVSIHPFDDGNGRLSRILMNLILMQKGYPPVVIKMDDRRNYYSLLSRADRSDEWPFVEYIAECLTNSMQLFFKAINGEDIDEEDDIDKKIALFKIEAESQVHLNEEKSLDKVRKIIIADLFTLFEKVIEKTSSFNELFLKVVTGVVFSYSGKRDGIIDHRYSDSQEFFSKESLPRLINFINKNNDEFSQIAFVAVHKDFKNSENMFSLRTEISVAFNRYNYFIYINGIKNITQLYSDSISEKHILKIIDSFIEAFMQSFKQNQKSPKS
jgi:Fic family protein